MGLLRCLLFIAFIFTLSCNSGGNNKNKALQFNPDLSGTLSSFSEKNSDGVAASVVKLEMETACKSVRDFSALKSFESYDVEVVEDYFVDGALHFDDGYKMRFIEKWAQFRPVVNKSGLSNQFYVELTINGDFWSDKSLWSFTIDENGEMIEDEEELLPTSQSLQKTEFKKTRSVSHIEPQFEEEDDDMVVMCEGESVPDSFLNEVQFAMYTLPSGLKISGILHTQSWKEKNYKCQKYKESDPNRIIDSFVVEGEALSAFETFMSINELNPVSFPCQGRSEIFSVFSTQDQNGKLLRVNKREVTKIYR